jgi:hypothetical protein
VNDESYEEPRAAFAPKLTRPTPLLLTDDNTFMENKSLIMKAQKPQLELHPKSSCAFTFGASRSPLRGEDEVLALYDGATPHTPAFATQMP